MRHPVRSDIADHRLSRQAEFGGESLVPRARFEMREVRAVGDDADFPGLNTARDQIALECVRNGDHPRRVPVEEEFELFERIEDLHVPHRAHRSDGFRPEVAQLEHIRTPLEQPGNISGAGREKLRRGRDDHVYVADAETCGHRRNHEARIIERSFEEALIGTDVSPDPDDIDALDCLSCPPSVGVAVEHLAGRKIWRASDDSHLMPGPDPLAAMLEGP